MKPSWALAFLFLAVLPLVCYADLLNCGTYRTYNNEFEVCAKSGVVLCKSSAYAADGKCGRSDFILTDPYTPGQQACSQAPDGSFNFCQSGRCCVNTDPSPSPPLCFTDSIYQEDTNTCTSTSGVAAMAVSLLVVCLGSALAIFV
eukprot:gnl/Spiro4/11669_TR6161_c0_g1_i1.p1 gnl/Spiro4/11669_TR6161_c0_g1~~gnl/Spiro4/11669_TR6161_c0_g1_i1.p1  ORF type:complete len:156 (-),score=26.05 gnl/Spiro4/11669_TR6161_c0_g1_i1:82-516(-)